MDITVDILERHTDSRGSIMEFLTAKEVEKLGGYGHMFVATFDSPKKIRGNHYHEKQHEFYAIVSGKIKVVLYDLKTKKKKIVTMDASSKKFKRLRIGPMIAHACFNITPTAVLVSYFKYPYNSKKPDAIFHPVLKK